MADVDAPEYEASPIYCHAGPNRRNPYSSQSFLMATVTRFKRCHRPGT